MDKGKDSATPHNEPTFLARAMAWNWRRGLFRIWLVAAFGWEATILGLLLDRRGGVGSVDLGIALFVFVAIPFGVLIGGALFVWAIEGFRPAPPSS